MIFRDFEEAANPLNGCRIVDVETLLRSARGRLPFVAELEGDHGFKLTVGIGEKFGTVQHSQVDGDVPYWGALGASGAFSGDPVAFACGGQPAEIDSQFLLKPEEFIAICRHFAETGGRLESFQWEEI